MTPQVSLLEQEMLDLLGADRSARITASYFGLDGWGPRTLKAVGTESGITRQRVLQIVAGVLKRRPLAGTAAPILDRALAIAASRIPTLASDIENELKATGLTATSFRLEGLVKAAHLFGRPVPFRILSVKHERIVHNFNPIDLEAIDRISRRLVARWGFCQIAEVAAEVNSADSRLVRPGIVGTVLTWVKDFHWLDEASGWFWLSDITQNAALTRIRKIMSVANPIILSDLKAAVMRTYRMRHFSPPSEVLLELCRQVPALKVCGHLILADPPLRSEEQLSAIEMKFVRQLSVHGGIMTRAELKQACCGIGITPLTIDQHIAYSPLIYRHGKGLYSLVGAGRVTGVTADHTA